MSIRITSTSPSIAGLGNGVGDSGQHGTSCHLRIGGVALTLPVSSRPVRAVDLNDGKAPAGQEPGQSGAIGTRAFDPEGAHFSKVSGPPFQLPIPVTGRWCQGRRESSPSPSARTSSATSPGWCCRRTSFPTGWSAWATRGTTRTPYASSTNMPTHTLDPNSPRPERNILAQTSWSTFRPSATDQPEPKCAKFIQATGRRIPNSAQPQLRRQNSPTTPSQAAVMARPCR